MTSLNIKKRLEYQKRKLNINGKDFFPLKEVLIFDIETRKINKNGAISADNSKLVIWGVYSFRENKIYMGQNAVKFKELLATHRIIVGHNIKDFDMPILKRDLGISFWDNLPLDLFEILRKPPSKGEKESFKKKGKRPIQGKGRSLIIGEARINGMIDNRFPDLKLSTIARHGHKLFHDHPQYSQYFNEYKQDDFDYDILGKDNLTQEDWKYIKTYLKQDLIVTKNLFAF